MDTIRKFNSRIEEINEKFHKSLKNLEHTNRIMIRENL